MRGLRFHLFPQRPNYIRGVGLDVFEVFRKTMAELGWVVQFFCDHCMLAPTAPALREIARDMTVIVDHLGMVPAGQGVNDPNFRPHPSIPADVMPDDGHLVDLFHDWTPDANIRQQILVETPARLFGK
jgi:2-pyrone-4,6-dicarboxylate lactonase